jgi:hypothetical protein
MTSSKRKHHPPNAAVVSAVPRSGASPATSARASSTKAPLNRAPQAAVPPAGTSSPATRRQWVIRSVGVLAIAIGLSITLLGVTPGIAGGWGKLVLSVPGMVIATGGLIAVIETTSMARSKRR